ncbi:expressed unknown protein [Seminavis robusta]|uniref:Uncharacterized protein n=1 Tax=Seminavis robusta TaxID=568900 RepID=A0A9N8H3U4_9STRA|nr:expressed unknown protein [Seminavis robusta]|eukprot:Sro1_g000120.1 n/a (1351) ;mRNA; f:45189-49312
MASLCSPLMMQSRTSSLVALLQASIMHVSQDEFDPVLYQAMASLHEYIGSHQERCMMGRPGSVVSTAQYWKTRPAFYKPNIPNRDNVVASGWLEQMTTVHHPHHNNNDNTTKGKESKSKSKSAITWETVLMLLVLPGMDDESTITGNNHNNNSSSNMSKQPYLRIAQEVLCESGQFAPKLRTKHKIPLHSKFLRCEPVNLYGDIRLVLHIGAETSGIQNCVITFRCKEDTAAAAAWVSELQRFLDPNNSNSNGSHNKATKPLIPSPSKGHPTIALSTTQSSLLHCHSSNSSSSTVEFMKQQLQQTTSSRQEMPKEKLDPPPNNGADADGEAPKGPHDEEIANQSVEVEMDEENDGVNIHDGLDYDLENPSDEDMAGVSSSSSSHHSNTAGMKATTTTTSAKVETNATKVETNATKAEVQTNASRDPPTETTNADEEKPQQDTTTPLDDSSDQKMHVNVSLDPPQPPQATPTQEDLIEQARYHAPTPTNAPTPKAKSVKNRPPTPKAATNTSAQPQQPQAVPSTSLSVDTTEPPPVEPHVGDKEAPTKEQGPPLDQQAEPLSTPSVSTTTKNTFAIPTPISTSSSKEVAEEKLQELEPTATNTPTAAATASPKFAVLAPKAAPPGARQNVVQERKKLQQAKQQQHKTPQQPQGQPQPKPEPPSQQQVPQQPKPQAKTPQPQIQMQAQTQRRHPSPHQKVHQIKQQRQMYQQQQRQAGHQPKVPQSTPQPQSAGGTPKATSTAAAAAATIQMEKELRVENQKKAANERRRQDLELQRKLARVEQKCKDLESKRKFLEKEQRKQELIAKAAQRPSNDTSIMLQQIQQQMKTVDADMGQKKTEIAQMQAEIESRKNIPIQATAAAAGNNTSNAPSTTTTASTAAQPVSQADAAAQRRLAEQARRERYLEAQKKAAVEKRRQELEEQRRKAREEQKRRDEEKKRRFMEQEQRKQDLMAKAKAGKIQPDQNSALMKKMNNQMFALDAEAEKRAEDAKAEEEENNNTGQEQEQEEEVEDPETARMRIAEEARQRQLEEEAKRVNTQPVNEKPTVKTAQQPHASGEAGWPAWSQQPTAAAPPFQSGAHQNPAQYQGPQNAHFQNQTPHHHPNHPSSVPMPSSPHVYNQYQQQPEIPYRAHAAFNVNVNPQSPQPNYATSPTPHQPSPAGNQRARQPPQQSPGEARPSPHPYPYQQPPTPNASGPTSHQQNQGQSGSGQKYGKMVAQNDDDDPSMMTDLKRNVIVGWALRPSDRMGLKPVHELLRSIQTVFPPANNVAAHAYFDGWKPITADELLSPTGAPEEKKLNKAVRKLRFFLHPDKLPRDLTDEQHFLCKLLWDITNDSWEEYKKAAEELDWMN